jgi:hypothetical protein
MMKLPMQTGMNALWQRSGAAVNNLRQGSGSVGIGHQGQAESFATPWVRGFATDPLVTLIDNSSGGNGRTFQVHVPVGTTAENSAGGTESGIGGVDTMKPYVVWVAQGCTINGTAGGAIHSGTGNTIECNTGLGIEDGTGPLLMDAVIGSNFQIQDNMIGNIQDFDLTALRNNPNYFPQHMLTIYLDPSQNLVGHIWPLTANDVVGSGLIPEGALIGIPADVPMPAGLSPGGRFLWQNVQQFGWLHYNIAGVGTIQAKIWVIDPANNAIANDIANSISQIVPHLCLYTGQTSVNNMKGMVNGIRSDAFPAPPPLDYSPTGGHPVQPSSFGAWYGHGLNGSVGIYYDTIWPAVAGSPTPTPTPGKK